MVEFGDDDWGYPIWQDTSILNSYGSYIKSPEGTGTLWVSEICRSMPMGPRTCLGITT